jgi:hypothetical protein
LCGVERSNKNSASDYAYQYADARVDLNWLPICSPSAPPYFKELGADLPGYKENIQKKCFSNSSIRISVYVSAQFLAKATDLKRFTHQDAGPDCFWSM